VGRLDLWNLLRVYQAKGWRVHLYRTIDWSRKIFVVLWRRACSFLEKICLLVFIYAFLFASYRRLVKLHAPECDASSFTILSNSGKFFFLHTSALQVVSESYTALKEILCQITRYYAPNNLQSPWSHLSHPPTSHMETAISAPKRSTMRTQFSHIHFSWQPSLPAFSLPV